jgi:hypothetical protein
MPANLGETDVLNYLMKTGPIPLADLALRFDDPPMMLRTLNDLKERGEVDIVDMGQSGPCQPENGNRHALERIIDRISEFPPDEMREESYSVLLGSPEAQSTVRLTDKGFKKII